MTGHEPANALGPTKYHPSPCSAGRYLPSTGSDTHSASNLTRYPTQVSSHLRLVRGVYGRRGIPVAAHEVHQPAAPVAPSRGTALIAVGLITIKQLLMQTISALRVGADDAYWLVVLADG